MIVAKPLLLFPLFQAVVLLENNIIGTFAFCNIPSSTMRYLGQCSTRTIGSKRMDFGTNAALLDTYEDTVSLSPLSEKIYLKKGSQKKSINHNINKILPGKINKFSQKKIKVVRHNQNNEAIATKRRQQQRGKKRLRIDVKVEPTATFSKTKKTTPDLLTREEEKELTNEIRRLDTLLRIREGLVLSKREGEKDCDESDDFISESEWAEACGLSVIQLHDVIWQAREAKNRMVSANRGLVVLTAKKFIGAIDIANEQNNGLGTILSYQDLIQEGQIGLLEAIRRFDPELGNKFSTYAVWWIRQRMIKAVYDYSRTIRLPPHVHHIVLKIGKVRKDLESQNGRWPTNQELAERVGISIEKLETYSKAFRAVVSLDHRPGFGKKQSGSARESATMGELISCSQPTPHEDAEKQSMREALLSAVNELPSKERKVLVGLYGLNANYPKTPEEISKDIGLPCCRINTVKTQALKRLRNNRKQILNLKPYIDWEVAEYVNFGEKEKRKKREDLTPEEIWSF